jgi:nitrogen fixation NifU-like protein
MDELDRQTYVELLLDHFENPRQRGRDEAADVVMSGGNPSCGDVVVLYIRRGSGDALAGVQFEGHGCTVSQAGASLTAELATGRRMAECEALGQNDLVALMGQEVVRARAPCAMIALDLLKAGIAELRAREPDGAA